MGTGAGRQFPGHSASQRGNVSRRTEAVEETAAPSRFGEPFDSGAKVSAGNIAILEHRAARLNSSGWRPGHLVGSDSSSLGSNRPDHAVLIVHGFRALGSCDTWLPLPIPNCCPRKREVAHMIPPAAQINSQRCRPASSSDFHGKSDAPTKDFPEHVSLFFFLLVSSSTAAIF